MLEKSNTWPEQVLDTLNSCWRALLESLSNTQANVRRLPLSLNTLFLSNCTLFLGIFRSKFEICNIRQPSDPLPSEAEQGRYSGAVAGLMSRVSPGLSPLSACCSSA